MGLVGNVFLTIIAAITFVIATVGINLVANFIPPAYDLSNLAPQRISFKAGGYLTAVIGFIIGALWVATISRVGLPMFVDTLGAILASTLWVLVADYYVVRKRQLNINALFTMDPGGEYYFHTWVESARIYRGRCRRSILDCRRVDARISYPQRFCMDPRSRARRSYLYRGNEQYEMPEAMSDVKNLAL